MNIHKGEDKRKKYICFITNCKKSYFYICTLKKHIQQSHSEDFNDLIEKYGDINFHEIYTSMKEKTKKMKIVVGKEKCEEELPNLVKIEEKHVKDNIFKQIKTDNPIGLQKSDKNECVQNINFNFNFDLKSQYSNSSFGQSFNSNGFGEMLLLFSKIISNPISLDMLNLMQKDATNCEAENQLNQRLLSNTSNSIIESLGNSKLFDLFTKFISENINNKDSLLQSNVDQNSPINKKNESKFVSEHNGNSNIFQNQKFQKSESDHSPMFFPVENKLEGVQYFKPQYPKRVKPKCLKDFMISEDFGINKKGDCNSLFKKKLNAKAI